MARTCLRGIGTMKSPDQLQNLLMMYVEIEKNGVSLIRHMVFVGRSCLLTAPDLELCCSS